MLKLNLSQNGRFAPPGGWPLGLNAQISRHASGVCPSTVSLVTANVQADLQADVHLALFSAPLTVNASDSVLLAQTDALAVSTSAQDITVTVPSSLTPASFTPGGTITVSNASQAVAGSATSFPTDGQWTGYEISVKGYGWNQIASVQSATSLTLNNPTAAITAAAGAFYVRRPRPEAFVVMIWCDNVVGGTPETIARDSSILTIANQPQVPFGITVNSMVIG